MRNGGERRIVTLMVVKKKGGSEEKIPASPEKVKSNQSHEAKLQRRWSQRKSEVVLKPLQRAQCSSRHARHEGFLGA